MPFKSSTLELTTFFLPTETTAGGRERKRVFFQKGKEVG